MPPDSKNSESQPPLPVVPCSSSLTSVGARTTTTTTTTTESFNINVQQQQQEGNSNNNGATTTTNKNNMEESSTTTSQSRTPPDTKGYHSLSYAYETYLSQDREELNHWEDVCRSYRQYATFAMAQWANQQFRVHAIAEAQRKYLPAGLRRETLDFSERSMAYKEAAIRNQFCLDCILRHAGQPHSQESTSTSSATTSTSTGSTTTSAQQHSSDSSMSKVSSVLKSLARDWSAEGQAERDMAYNPIKESVQKYLPLPLADHADNRPIKICVPGAGVGRLACELASLGYAVQGNEFSLYMLLASDFILNGGIASPEKPLRISPFLLESRNVHSSTDPMRPISIPDVDPYSLLLSTTTNDSGAAGDNDGQPETPDFSMAGGEFASIYSQGREKGAWDCVVACFFLDTSPCITEYLLVIHHMLRPGGYLINFGPLLWHWSGPAMRPDDRSVEEYHARYSYLDKKYMHSIDLSWEDVREIMINIGFEFVEERLGQTAFYTADERSMMQMNYHCVHFVARRKAGDSDEIMESKPSSQPTTAPTSLQRSVR